MSEHADDSAARLAALEDFFRKVQRVVNIEDTSHEALIAELWEMRRREGQALSAETALAKTRRRIDVQRREHAADLKRDCERISALQEHVAALEALCEQATRGVSSVVEALRGVESDDAMPYEGTQEAASMLLHCMHPLGPGSLREIRKRFAEESLVSASSAPPCTNCKVLRGVLAMEANAIDACATLGNDWPKNARVIARRIRHVLDKGVPPAIRPDQLGMTPALLMSLADHCWAAQQTAIEVAQLLESGVTPEQLADDARAKTLAPIPMYLTCPSCNARHVDAGEFATKPHHTHSCQTCGLTWRPAVVATVGVQFLPGFKDETAPTSAPATADVPKVLEMLRRRRRTTTSAFWMDLLDRAIRGLGGDL